MSHYDYINKRLISLSLYIYIWYHFLFSSDPASTEETKATEGVVGRGEEGRQGGHDVGDLGHHHQHGERDSDAADRR